MSVWEAGRVWREAPHKGAVLCVLLSAAYESNDDGVCFLKVKTLARDARVSERAVQHALRKLARCGDLRCMSKSSGPGIALRYQLGVKYLHPSNAKGVHSVPPMGADFAKRGADFAAPLFRENKTNVSKPMGGEKSPAQGKPPAADRGASCKYCDNTGIFEAQDGRLKGFCECPAGQELQRANAAAPLVTTGLTPERRSHARRTNAAR